MGAYGLLNPRWAQGLVRLRDDPEKPGGFAEFRGTYGGLFLASHLVALVLMVAVAREIEDLGGVPTLWTALGAAACCGAMWIGTAIGRIASILRDATGTKYNQASVAFELALGLVVVAPWFLR
jgi:hypothetical protein